MRQQTAAAWAERRASGAWALLTARRRAALAAWSAGHGGWAVDRYKGARLPPWTDAELAAHPAATGRTIALAAPSGQPEDPES